MFMYIIIIFILLHVICDINYVVRTILSVLSGPLYQRKYLMSETTTIYGLCTFLDCDVTFNHMRAARLLRDLDFARYHFYERTGIYRRSRIFAIKSLQGCTLTIMEKPIPLFSSYKINTKIIFWDDCSVFLEHEIITLSNDKVCYLMVSRQHAIATSLPIRQPVKALLAGIPPQLNIKCPEYIRCWLRSMEICSSRLKRI